MLNNASIKVANDVAYFVHNTLQSTGTSVSTNLDFLWIPYYGYNSIAATVIKNIGYVTARTNIFDIVIIQPAYYFYYTSTNSDGTHVSKTDSDAVLITNLNGVKYSIDKNNICYRDGIEVISRLSSATATVGFEMEIDYVTSDAYYDSSRKSKATRYKEYVDKFIDSRSKPMCYYAGGKDSLVARITKIDNFYSGTTNTSELYI